MGLELVTREEKPSFKLTDWNEITRYKTEAGRIASDIETLLKSGERVSWDHLKQMCGTNLTLWKLLLRELRERGLEIGNHRNQFVTLNAGKTLRSR